METPLRDEATIGHARQVVSDDIFMKLTRKRRDAWQNKRKEKRGGRARMEIGDVTNSTTWSAA